MSSKAKKSSREQKRAHAPRDKSETPMKAKGDLHVIGALKRKRALNRGDGGDGNADDLPFEEVSVQEDESWESDNDTNSPNEAPIHDEFVEFGVQSDEDDQSNESSELNNDKNGPSSGSDPSKEESDEGHSEDVDSKELASASIKRAQQETSRRVDNRASKALQMRFLSEYDAMDRSDTLTEAHARAVGEAAYERDLFYDSEDSENERELITVGNVPLEWYDEYDHIGYDLEGKKILARPGDREGEIDRLVAQNEHPWSVFNERTRRRELISAEDMAFVQKMRRGIEQERYAPEKWFIQLDKFTDPIHATSQAPEPKRRFLPSKWEARRVRRLAYAIKHGWIKLDDAQQVAPPQWSLIWDEANSSVNPSDGQWSAPKLKLPGHAESYNPPSEYLYDEHEKDQWEALDEHERPIPFLPKQNASLRLTPGYDRFQRERFERCLDLYLAVRSQRVRANIDPNSLLPRLPKPSELRPFPSLCTITYTGHSSIVRSIDIDPSGRWLASGDDSGFLHVYELTTGRLFAQYRFDAAITHLAWCPREDVMLLAVASENAISLYHLNQLASVPQISAAIVLFQSMAQGVTDSLASNALSDILSWKVDTLNSQAVLKFTSRALGSGSLQQISWHHKGDYLASVCPQAQIQRAGVLVHQISRARSQAPFSKLKGHVQAVRFHPSKPFLFVGTQRHVRVYNLLEQRLQRTLQAGVPWMSSLAVHPSGDHVLCGGYDSRVCWLDLDMSAPFKVLRYHRHAVRAARFHSRYPLFATCSDDGSIHVFHGSVADNDVGATAFIVPLKVLRGHDVVDELGVIDIAFHPYQPWLISASADHTIKLWVNVS